MKKILGITILGLIVMQCAFATPYGLILTNVTEPVAVSGETTYTKKATGGAFSLLGCIGMGDASIDSIAKSGGIKNIKYVDKNTFALPLGLIVSETYTVYGD